MRSPTYHLLTTIFGENVTEDFEKPVFDIINASRNPIRSDWDYFDVDNVRIRCVMRIAIAADNRRFFAMVNKDNIDLYTAHPDGSWHKSNWGKLQAYTKMVFWKTEACCLGVSPFYMLYCQDSKKLYPYECVLMLPYSEKDVMGTFLLNDDYTYTLLQKLFQNVIDEAIDISKIEIQCAMRIDTLDDLRRFLAGVSQVDDKTDVFLFNKAGTWEAGMSFGDFQYYIHAARNLSASTPSSLNSVAPYYMLYCREKDSKSPYECIVSIPAEAAKKVEDE